MIYIYIYVYIENFSMDVLIIAIPSTIPKISGLAKNAESPVMSDNKTSYVYHKLTSVTN